MTTGRVMLVAGTGVLATFVAWGVFSHRATAPGPVRVGVDHSPPYYLIEPDGSVKGLAVDILNEAARRRGITLEWKPLHDIPLEDALDHGIVDMWPLVGSTPERRKKYFLSKPWLESEYVLVSLQEQPLHNPKDAEGKTIAHARLKFTGIVARQYLPKSHFDIRLVRSQAIQALCYGEASGVLIESHVLDAILLTRPAGCATANFHIANLTGATTPLSIAAVRKVAVPAKELRDEITAMSGDGFLSARLDEWSPFSAQGTRSIWAEEAANARSRLLSIGLLLFLTFSLVLAWISWRAARLKSAAEVAERGRREIERRFTAFMAHSPVSAFMKDAAGRLLYVNEAWTKLFNRRPEDCYGKTDVELWPAETARQFRHTDESLLIENKPRQLIETVPISSMESRDLLVVKFPFENELGERFVGGTAIDVSEREKALRDLEASEARYRILFEQNPLAAWVYDRQTLGFLTVNESAVKQYGWSRQDFLSGMRVTDILARGDVNWTSADPGVIDQTLSGAESSQHVARDGRLLTVDVTSYELEYEYRPARLMIVRDLSERERTLEQLRVSEERWRLALKGAGDALWDWDIEADRVYRSPRWCSMLGYDDSEIGDRREDLMRLIHPEDAPVVLKAVADHLSGKTQNFSTEYRLRHKDGTWRWIRDRGQAIRNSRGQPVRMAGSHTDITDRRAAEDLLAMEARTDALTGAANRREFERASEAWLRNARLTGEPFSLVICDLDHFKQVNDYYGHAAGDRVLIAFTTIIRRNIRRTDVLARIGGDEFVLALPNTNVGEACQMMERIREQLRSTDFLSADGVEFHVTGSFGIAEFRESHADCLELMKEADRQLYDAKGGGRDRTLAA